MAETLKLDEQNLDYMRKVHGNEAVDNFLSEFNSGIDEDDFSEKSNSIYTQLIYMDMAGDNRWWLNPDLRIAAYYQLRQEILFINFTDFKKGLADLLGYSVSELELAFSYEKLIRDSEEAFQKLQNELKAD